MKPINEEEKYIQIEQYLDNKLSQPERDKFEQQLRREPALAETMEDLLLARQLIKEYGLRRDIAIFHTSSKIRFAATPSRRRVWGRIGKYLGVACGLLLIIALAVMYMDTSAEKIYNKNFSPYKLRTEMAPAPVSPLESAYRAQNYAKVLQLYRQSPTGSPKNAFLAGNAALLINNTTQAVQCFQRVIEINQKQGSNTFSDHAQWYLALAYLRKGEVSRAQSLLHLIAHDPQHQFHTKVSGWLYWQTKLLSWKNE